MTPRRRSFFGFLLIAGLAATFALVPAAAQGEGEGEEGQARETFQLEGRLLARDPVVSAALRQARKEPTAVHWNDLGKILAGRGAYLDAEQAFERAARKAPESSTYISNRGAARLRLGDTGGALNDFQAALKIEPFDAVAYYNLAVAHDKLGHYDRAIEAYKSAFLLDPSLKDPGNNPAVVNNEHILAIGLEVYLETAGGTPALYGDSPDGK